MTERDRETEKERDRERDRERDAQIDYHKEFQALEDTLPKENIIAALGLWEGLSHSVQ